MSAAPDPFSHHPELREKIVDPQKSFFRDLDLEKLAKPFEARGGASIDWWYPDADREADRAAVLADRRDADLWVFGYGSLMWDPGIVFAEVRRAFVPDHARRFILRDIHGARGTREIPGLMAALDRGSGCEGLAFRIDREHVESETRRLWARERIGPGYIASFVDAELSDGRVPALTFVADHDAELIAADLTRAEQVHCFATGTGFLGTSLQYLENIASHFEALGIHDEDVEALLRETKAYMGTLPAA